MLGICRVLEEPEYHEWTKEEIDKQLTIDKEFHSRWKPKKKANPPIRRQEEDDDGGDDEEGDLEEFYSQPATPTPRSSNQKQFSRSAEISSQEGRGNQESRQTLPSARDDRNVHFGHTNQATLPSTYSTNIRRGQLDDDYQSPRINPVKALTDLSKLYIGDEDKYGGERYDVLELKLRIFRASCDRIGLQEEYYKKALPLMLKGRAKDFYYDKLMISGEEFGWMVSEITKHFETIENTQGYLKEWESTTFLSVILANPEKNKMDCLELLFDKLQKIQRALPIDYRTERSLKDKVVRSCRGINECSMALLIPVDSYQGVCEQLRTAVATAMEVQKSQQFIIGTIPTTEASATTDDDDLQESYWTDRTYGGRGTFGGRNRGRFKGRYRGGGSGGSRESRRKNQYGNQYGSQGGSQGDKKCYICGKSGCWSTKHSIEERQRSYELPIHCRKALL